MLLAALEKHKSIDIKMFYSFNTIYTHVVAWYTSGDNHLTIFSQF